MEMQQRHAVQGDVPEISQFLDDNKGRVDRDPDCLAYDDLRHYAYEGDGNSGGSLSSLISGQFTVIFVINFYKQFLTDCFCIVQVQMTQIWISITCRSSVQDSRN